MVAPAGGVEGSPKLLWLLGPDSQPPNATDGPKTLAGFLVIIQTSAKAYVLSANESQDESWWSSSGRKSPNDKFIRFLSRITISTPIGCKRAPIWPPDGCDSTGIFPTLTRVSSLKQLWVIWVQKMFSVSTSVMQTWVVVISWSRWGTLSHCKLLVIFIGPYPTHSPPFTGVALLPCSSSRDVITSPFQPQTPSLARGHTWPKNKKTLQNGSLLGEKHVGYVLV